MWVVKRSQPQDRPIDCNVTEYKFTDGASNFIDVQLNFKNPPPELTPKTQEGEIGRLAVWGQSQQKVHVTSTQSISHWVQWWEPAIPATWEAQIKGSEVQAGLGIKVKPYWKNNKGWNCWGMAQVGKCLPGKSKALSSNSNTVEKKDNKRMHFLSSFGVLSRISTTIWKDY